MEFLGKFNLPLLCQVRRTEDCGPLDLSSVKKFAGYQASFYRFAYAYIVSNEYPDRIKLESHQEGNKLIWPGFHRNPPKAAKRAAVCPG
jgi:hypothetical protein